MNQILYLQNCLIVYHSSYQGQDSRPVLSDSKSWALLTLSPQKCRTGFHLNLIRTEVASDKTTAKRANVREGPYREDVLKPSEGCLLFTLKASVMIRGSKRPKGWPACSCCSGGEQSALPSGQWTQQCQVWESALSFPKGWGVLAQSAARAGFFSLWHLYQNITTNHNHLRHVCIKVTQFNVSLWPPSPPSLVPKIECGRRKTWAWSFLGAIKGEDACCYVPFPWLPEYGLLLGPIEQHFYFLISSGTLAR
jgi:hypothetical protein